MAILAIAALGQPAGAHEQGPVCRVPTVVDEMARQIRTANHYAQVDARLVTEQPTATPNLVRCQVCVLDAPYDMPRFGPQPIRRCIAHGFEIRILQAGYVVRDLG
ncbi:MAG: hypothetical protein B7Z80_10140 [Rhodospirillales bacterium 20-64-7]|nr:MAG: hypothetical protein B7Z80_10140 [Rhodospirillales bacterium 20-64-7]